MFRPLLALLVFAAGARAAESTTPSALPQLTYSGDQSALDTLDRELQDAGKDPAKLAALEKRILGLVRASDSTFAARQALCQRLGLVLAQSGAPSPETAKRLGALLADERDSDLGRLALEPVSGPAVDALFIAALDKTGGRARLGLLDSIGRRRIAAAIAPVGALLTDLDAATASAAVRTLAAIGGTAALAPLDRAPAALRDAAAAAKVAIAQHLTPAEAMPVLRAVQADGQVGAATRAAAFRTGLAVEPAGAIEKVAGVLGGDDRPLKTAALEAIADLPGTDAGRTLVPKLSTWDAPTQAAVLHALGRRGDLAAIPAASAAVKHADEEVRLAALTALGLLPGSRATAAILAAASGGTSPEAKLARQSLARLSGPEVSAAIVAGASGGEPALRTVYLEQIALRGMSESIPLLFQCRQDPAPAVRTAALAALGDLAPASALPALLEWTLAATDEAEQTRALRSAVSVAQREPDAARRGEPLRAAIEAATPEVAERLLPALPRLGGETNAACAARLARRDHPALAAAAADTLKRWPDQTALAALVEVATQAPQPAARTAAQEGALQSLGKQRTWTDKTTAFVVALYPTVQDAGRKRQFVDLLARARDRQALDFATAQATDPAVGEAAGYAAAVIRANLAGSPSARAEPNGTAARSLLDGRNSTRWSVATAGEEWVQVDFKATRPLRRIVLDQFGRLTDYPERYEVYVTDDPQQPGQPIASGKGEKNKTTIPLPPKTQGRYLIIKNTQARADGQWAISELVVE